MPATGGIWVACTRFGLFITFGLYSIPAGVWPREKMGRNDYASAEWPWPESSGGIPRADYDTLLVRFCPDKSDAEVGGSGWSPRPTCPHERRGMHRSHKRLCKIDTRRHWTGCLTCV